ncbi:MAG TPA: alpha/beta hydrolase [Acidimicrobiales bacterium]|jgi:pimeloyl-ACP methyl ester carboxylesterase|nr:alpha/beta hydrolase [Acidimicrobiales bacterium]
MSYPVGLHIIERAAATAGSPTVVLVHGSLDRAESFRRVMRRLPDMGIVAYDRRGYGGSREAGVVELGGHIADLIDVVAEVRRTGPTLVAAVGHSLGGDVVVGAAIAEPRAFDAIGAFEPPMPWLGFRRRSPGGGPGSWTPMAEDPGDEAERFFSRMVSPSAWQRLTNEGRAARRADGPALVADMTGIRGGTPFDVMDLTVSAVFGMGGADTESHHFAAVTWLGDHVPGATSYEIEGSHHGAHLSHPDHFALFVRLVVEQGRARSGSA